MSDQGEQRSPNWKWWVCGLLLLATMILYLDRQTLALTIKRMMEEVGIDEGHFGKLEKRFSYAFAAGAIIAGFLADRVNVRWMYPVALFGWSLAGFATAYSSEIGHALAPIFFPLFGSEADWLGNNVETGRIYLGLSVCRIVLGFFEAGHWPCALVTTQRILTRNDRSFGNSVLQSGASMGAVLAPQVVWLLMSETHGSWRLPYLVTGAVGALWIVPWLLVVKRDDLARPIQSTDNHLEVDEAKRFISTQPQQLIPRIIALACVVISINLTWQFFRAWLPLFLEKQHEYSSRFTQNFLTVYNILADVGCISVGVAVKTLASRGMKLHRARMLTFGVCTALTGMAVLLPQFPAGPTLLGVLMLLAAGSLGLFPNYYAFTQEISHRHQGKVSGILAALTWCVTGYMQDVFGESIKRTQSYEFGIRVAGLAPLFGLFALLVLWNMVPEKRTENAPT